MHKAWLAVFGTANTAKYNVLVAAINDVVNSRNKRKKLKKYGNVQNCIQ